LVLQLISAAPPGGPVPPPNQRIADALDDAKEALKKRYEEVRRGK
jgi:hypothetical protein